MGLLSGRARQLLAIAAIMGSVDYESQVAMSRNEGARLPDYDEEAAARLRAERAKRKAEQFVKQKKLKGVKP